MDRQEERWSRKGEIELLLRLRVRWMVRVGDRTKSLGST